MLPFENLGAPEDDYFADGIADDMRGKLTSLPGLQVIARGSSTPYKKTTKTPKQIAEELRSYTCSRRRCAGKKSGATACTSAPSSIDVTRPDAPTSKWQQPFDAAITDVFQVQSEIATKVAQALGAALGAGEEKRLSEKPTQNLAAYDAFLKGEEIRNSGAIDPASVRREIGFYEQAVALDPGFAQAWAGLSGANSLLYGNSTPTPALAERARQAAEKAIALAPNRPEGYLALGNYERRFPWTSPAPWSSSRRGCALPPATPGSQGNGACRGGPRTLGCGGGASQAGRSPRSPVRSTVCGPLATRSCVCGAIPRRGRLSTVVSPSRLPSLF